MTTLSLPTARARPLWHWRPTTQGVMTVFLLLFCGGLVGYPIVYLVLESLNTGDADIVEFLDPVAHQSRSQDRFFSDGNIAGTRRNH